MSDYIRVVEVGPRDGLQNQAGTVPTDTKIELINRLTATGLSMIEATSFVSPKAIPQLQDADAVFRGINKMPGVSYPVLIPNLEGYERARDAGAQHVAVFASASETFSQKNIRFSISDSLKAYASVVKQAKNQGLWVRGYISCVLGCPFEGNIAPGAVVDVGTALMKMGVDELSLGDTIGVGTPKSMNRLIQLCSNYFPMNHLAVHCHDTYGQALANVYAALEQGVRIVDSAVAGLGGCPYAKGATGNLATEDLVYMLNGQGFDTGIDLEQLVSVGEYISQALNIPNQSKAGRAILAKR